MTESSTPVPSRLRLGQLVATPAAVAALSAAHMSIYLLLNRHARGDWGDLCAEDRTLNDLAAITGQRVLSSYLLGNGQKVWIITEGDSDHRVTTVLLPENY